MSSICQLDKYSATVSELTGRIVYLNDAPDQYLVSPDINYSELEETANWWLGLSRERKSAGLCPPNLRRAVKALGGARSREDVAKALQCVLVTEFRDLVDTAAVGTRQKPLVHLMVRLWCCGVVAWPTKQSPPFRPPNLRLEDAGFSERTRSFLTRVRAYLDRNSSDDAANFRFILDNAMSRAGVNEIGDLTPETFYLTLERTRLTRLRSPGILGILSALREEHYEHAIAWQPEDFGFFKANPGNRTRDRNFNWLISEDTSMAEWARVATEHVEQNPTNFRKRKSSIVAFMKHYLQHPELPRNPAEYFDVRRRPTALFDIPGNKGRMTMTVLHDFLNDVLFKVCALPDDNEVPVLMPGFANPLRWQSYKNVNQGETHREPMPTRLINLAAHILTDNDFAWAKEAGRIKDSFRWWNSETEEFETVWSPVRAYAILLRLLLPARTYQIRMLDSGEGDTFRYEAVGKWAINMGPHRPSAGGKPVERGVFRRYSRKDGSDGAVFYFNTNKSNDIDKIATGYVMPWEKKDALRLMAELRAWQEKYNPVKGPTPWTDISELKKLKHTDDLAKMGSNFFLFRDPANRSRTDLPLTDPRVRGLWLRLMDELEKRLRQAGEKLSNGSPIKIVLSRDRKTGLPSKAVFDLHSMRVSIVTAMYEAGVPPEYLMKIVGHATVLMTLYYTKIHAEALSLRMDEAVLARQNSSQAEMAGFVTRASRKEIEKAVAFHNPAALDAATAGNGIGILVMDHGLCPVSAKRCHEGLAVTDPATNVTRCHPVPGGATNCTRCRFFMTGPAFLFGLEAHVNDLAYRLKKSSFAFEKSQERFDALADEQAASLDGGRPFHKQREIEIAETSFEAATAEVDGVALSLQAAYGLTERCIQIANQTEGGELALVVGGGVGLLEAVLSEGHEFEQLNRICVAATLFDGLNIKWQQPNLERARLFDRMLRNSGFEAHFCLLDDEVALHVANAMSKFMYARLDANAVHALVDGRTTLRAVGLEKAFVAELQKLESKKLGSVKTTCMLEQS